MSLHWNSAPFPKEIVMVSGAYLRQQAEILIAMSRATFDLGIARRLREMALELQARAVQLRDRIYRWDRDRGCDNLALARVEFKPFLSG
jgi:uncharacterized protein YfeS